MADKKFKIYLFLCVLMFFVSLPIVLFYTFGYKYSIKDGKTVRTGIVTIRTLPKDVDVYIDDIFFKNTRDLSGLFNDYAKVEGLSQRSYDITVKKDGYFSWNKNIKVTGGYVTEFKNIALLRTIYPKNVLLNDLETQSGSNNIFLSSQNDKMIYIKNINKKPALFVINLRNKISAKIADSASLNAKEIKGNYSFGEFFWSDDDTKIVFSIKNGKTVFWHVADLSDQNKIYSLEPLKNQQMTSHWNMDIYGDLVLYLDKNGLNEINYKKGTSRKVLDDASGFMIKDGYVYYYMAGNDTLRSARYGDLADTRAIANIPAKEGFKSLWKIIKSNRNTYLLISQEGYLYFIDETGNVRLVNTYTKEASFFNDARKIVYYNNHEIWIYYIEEKIQQPSKAAFSNELITRYSGNLSGISLYKDEEHVFYKEGETFKFTEFDDRDLKNTFDVLRSKSNDVFYIKNSNSIVYAENNQLVEMELN